LICYLFSRPTQVMGRMAALGLLVMQLGVTNQQTYKFLDVANLAVASALIFSVLAIATYFPFSFRPEHVFLRLLGRFFPACAYLGSTMAWDPARTPTWAQRLRRAVSLHALTTIPGKLAIWGSALPAAALGRSTPGQVQALVDSLQALAYRMQDLIEAGATPQSQALARELLSQVRAWRVGVPDVFRHLPRRPRAAGYGEFWRA